MLNAGKSIEPLRRSHGFVGCEDGNRFGVAVIGCAKRDPVMLSIANETVQAFDIPGDVPSRLGSGFFTTNFLAHPESSSWRVYSPGVFLSEALFGQVHGTT